MFSDHEEAKNTLYLYGLDYRNEMNGKVLKRGDIFMEKTGIMGTETYYELLRDNSKTGDYVLGKLISRDGDLEGTEREVNLKTLKEMKRIPRDQVVDLKTLKDMKRIPRELIKGTVSVTSTEGGKKRKSRKLKKKSKRKSRKARKSHKKRR